MVLVLLVERERGVKWKLKRERRECHQTIQWRDQLGAWKQHRKRLDSLAIPGKDRESDQKQLGGEKERFGFKNLIKGLSSYLSLESRPLTGCSKKKIVSSQLTRAEQPSIPPRPFSHPLTSQPLMSTSLNSLSPELVNQILSQTLDYSVFINNRQLKKISLVCKNWSEIAR